MITKRSLRPVFVVAKDGHVFACAHRAAFTLVTNENGCQTRVVWAHFKKLVGC